MYPSHAGDTHSSIHPENTCLSYPEDTLLFHAEGTQLSHSGDTHPFHPGTSLRASLLLFCFPVFTLFGRDQCGSQLLSQAGSLHDNKVSEAEPLPNTGGN